MRRGNVNSAANLSLIPGVPVRACVLFTNTESWRTNLISPSRSQFYTALFFHLSKTLYVDIYGTFHSFSGHLNKSDVQNSAYSKYSSQGQEVHKSNIISVVRAKEHWIITGQSATVAISQLKHYTTAAIEQHWQYLDHSINPKWTTVIHSTKIK